MPLKKLGEKLKSSFHHFSPKNKKNDDATEGGDLSPCNLPPSTATQENPFSHYAPSQPETFNCNSEYLAENKQPEQQEKQQQVAAAAEREQNKATTAAAPAVGAGPAEKTVIRVATPRYEESADIFPTMYYKIQTEKAKKEIEQSVLLVNPSRSDKASERKRIFENIYLCYHFAKNILL